MITTNAAGERDAAREGGDLVRRNSAVFDRAAAGYDREPLRIFAFSADRLVEYAGIGPGHKVLDVATGTGAVALAAAQMVGPSGRVIAIDTAERMLDRAQAKIAQFGVANVDLHLMDAESLEFRAGYFDAVVCSHALDLLPDMEAAIRGWMRVLRPGGVIAFSVLGAGAFEPMASLLSRRIEGRETPGSQPLPVPGLHRLAAPERCQQLLEGAGLRECRVTEEQLGYHLRDTREWWDLVMGSGLREFVDRLDPALADAVRDEHLAELASSVGENGLWLDGSTLLAAGRRA